MPPLDATHWVIIASVLSGSITVITCTFCWLIGDLADTAYVRHKADLDHEHKMQKINREKPEVQGVDTY